MLLYTTGNTPQTFTFKFPSKHNITQNTKKYIIVSIHQFHCFSGTVTILDPLDDLFMTHGENFENNIDTSGFRLCWSMRWLTEIRDFYIDTCGMRLDKKPLSTVENRKSWQRADNMYKDHIKNITT